jgi:hypothetical protein
MRDELIIPINEKESIVITTDNIGGIGMKEQDVVKVAYETVGYFSFRVAMMECIAAGAKPKAVVLQNFCGEKEWTELVSGIQQGLSELGLKDIQITGSTESNFPLVQSVVGLNVIGLQSRDKKKKMVEKARVALIGLPLVGEEVIFQADDVAPLSLFYELSLLEDVVVWPVGSKGVGYELQRLGMIGGPTRMDLQKSGGPSTSFLVVYPPEKELEIKDLSGKYYHLIT